MLGRRDINLLDDHERPGLASWLVLAVGAVLAGLAADHYLAAVELNEQLTERVEQLGHRAAAAARTHRRQGAEPKSAPVVRQAAADFPWELVLRELELAVGDRVAILSLDTDAAALHSRISAEARTIDDALALVSALRSSPIVREAFLLSHEARKGTPVPVIGFTLQVDWRPQ